MEIILELVHLIKREGIRSTKQFHSPGKGQLTDRYIHLILDKKIEDDDALARHLYQSDKSDPRYKNLKKRVKQKLLDCLPLIEPQHLGFKSEYNLAYHKCLKIQSYVMYLSRVAAYSTTLNLIKTYYKEALKYEFYDVLRTFSYILIKIYAMNGESRKVDLETEKLHLYIAEHNYATLAHTLYFQAISGLVRKSDVNERQMSLITNNLKHLEKLAQVSKSNEVKYWYFYLKISYLITIKDNERLDLALLDFEGIFKEWRNFPPARRIIYCIQSQSVLFYLKSYSDGLQFSTENAHLIKTQQNNWVLFKKLEFYHAINCDFDRAVEVYEEVTQSSFFKMNNNKATTQLWMINYAYLQFMLGISNHPMATKFNLYKFLNEVSIYNKDKPGYNFSIIILELLFCLLKNDLDRYIDRMTSLMAYRIRHLKTKAFKRSNVFAQLLLEVDKKNFNAEKLRQTSAKKLAYLSSIEDRLNINEWEIVGYDTLWKSILDLLELKR